MQLSFSKQNFLFLVLVLFISACANNNNSSPGTNSTTPTTPAVPLQNNNAGVDHYTCPNGHAGAASAGNCSVCGVALEHNQAYHNNQATPTPEITTTPTTPSTTTAASPAQNAAGEYHYTCPNGHAGAASAGSCSVCGSALAHNQAYHNTPGSITPTTTTPSLTPAAAGNGPTFAPMLQDNAGTPAARVPQATTTTAATPAKNARGEYHYTCPNGHAGAGAAGNCSVCGSALAHNAAYHN